MQRFQQSLLYDVAIYEFSAFKATIIGRNDRTISLSTNDRTLEEPDEIKFVGGIKSEYIFDNDRGFEPLRRLKAFSEFYQDLIRRKPCCDRCGCKKYFPSTLIDLANRIAASTNFGSNR